MHRRRFLTTAGSALLVAACAPARPGAGQRTSEPGPNTRGPDPDATAPSARSGTSGEGPVPHADATPSDPATDAVTPETETDVRTRDTRADADAETAAQADEPASAPDDPLPEPTEWGLHVTGVRTRLATDEPVVALTFDACGGPGGSGYDAELLDGLLAAGVPATLFINARWADTNPGVLRELVSEPRFELANHGTMHRPLSVTGRSAYGIRGTASPEEVLAEVDGCQALLTDLTGRPPRHFRSGTAHYDEVAVGLVQGRGLEVVNFDVLGDAGATATAAQVTAALLTARGGSIVLLHMNQPGSGTSRGVLEAIPQLRDRGLTFTTLGDRALA